MRITNNAFTAEHGWYSGQATSSETVQRGGVGAYHGEAQIRFKNAALNARNPFADNKPPYKERQLDFNFSGPIVRNRLTMSVNGNQNESQNVGTVHAITLDGPFDMGVVNPYLGRSVGANGTLQLLRKKFCPVRSQLRNQSSQQSGCRWIYAARSGIERARTLFGLVGKDGFRVLQQDALRDEF